MKYTKRLLSLLLAVVLTFTMSIGVFAAEGDPSVTLNADKTSVKKGDTVKITLGVDKDIAGILTLGMDLVYDTDVFEVKNITLADEDFEATENTGYINFLRFTTKKAGMTVYQGVIAEIEFEAKTTADNATIKIENLACVKTLITLQQAYLLIHRQLLMLQSQKLLQIQHLQVMQYTAVQT